MSAAERLLSTPPPKAAAEHAAPTIPLLSERPIFSSTWWLDAVAPGAWSEVRIVRDGRLRARLAYTTTRYPLVGDVIGMPPLTPFLGPELYEMNRCGSRQLGEQHELLSELIDGLPLHARFLQNFHPGVTNWLPFFWRGFTQHTRYTYQLPNLSDLEEIWSGFATHRRRAIRKAEKTIKIEADAPVREVYRLLQLTYTNQGRAVRYDCSVLERAAAAACARGQGRVWVARDAAGRAHAGIFLVWNRDTAYYLVGGSDPALRSSGAMCLLMWHAIRFAASAAHTFDFEGSMQPGIESFLRGFGPLQAPYFQVRRQTARAAFAVTLTRLARRLTQRATAAITDP